MIQFFKMAASVVRCRHCNLRQFWQYTNIRCVTTSGYYILMPEIPPDTEETNAVMNYKTYPQFSAVTKDGALTGTLKNCVHYEMQHANLTDKLKDQSLKKDFNTVFEPFERGSVPLNFSWKTAQQMSNVKGSEGYRDSLARVRPQVLKYKGDRWMNESLYNAVKEVNANKANLTELQQRLVESYLTNARLAGIELSGKDQAVFFDSYKQANKYSKIYREKVMICQKLFKHNIDDFSVVQDIPRNLLNLMAADRYNPSRGPWQITLHPHIYLPFMQYCSDRKMRHRVWHAYNNRASVLHTAQHLSNAREIDEIRVWKRQWANCLGYTNFAEMEMETKMANSVENVMNMLEAYKNIMPSLAAEQVISVQEFAASEGFDYNLEMWDLPYWRKRHSDHLYGSEMTKASQYFPMTKVLDELFKLCSELFGIQIKECTGQVETWHKDVMFFKVYDSSSGQTGDSEIAAFYVDPYNRPADKFSDCQMESGRERSDLMGTTPISYLNMNVQPPVGSRPALMSYNEVCDLFFQFGNGLQQMLTTVPYSEVGGQRNIERDAIFMVPLFMKMLFNTPSVLKSVSSHFESGEAMPDDLIQTVLKHQSHMSAFDKTNTLYLSAFDMEIYVSSQKSWFQIQKNTWHDYMPMRLDDDDNHICCFPEIFSDEWAASYYSLVWAEMMAADVLEEFTKAGFENKEKLNAVGTRFRETFLSLGGGVSASEVFRRFKGRDPSVDALMRYYKHNQ